MSPDPNAPDVSDVLGASGECPVITSGSGNQAKTWRIGWPDGRAKTRLNALLIGMAEENVRESNAGLSPARRAMAEKDFSEALRRGDYRTWGSGWLAEYNTPRGQLMFLLALLQGEQPSATEADAVMLFRDYGDEVTRALLRVAPPFFSLLIDDLEQIRTATPEAVKTFKLAMIAEAMGAVERTLAKFQAPPTPSALIDSK